VNRPPAPLTAPGLRRILWSLYAYNFCGDFVLVYPLYALMMTQRGLSPLQLSALFIVWSLTAFVAEVPTGLLADRYPRRWLLAANGVLTGLGYLAWLLFPSFWGYLAGFVLWGVGGSCASGAFEALLVDTLAVAGQAGRFTEIYGRTRAAAFCGILCAGLGASAAVSAGWGYGAILLASAASGLAVTLVALSLPDASSRGAAAQRPPSPIEAEERALHSSDPTDNASYFALLRSGLRFALKSPSFLRLILIIGVATSIYGCLEEYFALLARDHGLPERWQGVLMGAIAGTQALAAAQAWRFGAGPSGGNTEGRAVAATAFDREPPYGRHASGALPVVRVVAGRAAPVGLLLAASALLLLVAAAWRAPWGLVGLVLFCGVYTVAETQLAGELQALLPDGQRATLTSLSAFSGEVWGVLVYLSVGALATRWSYAAAFAAGAAVLLLTAGEACWRGRNPLLRR
jgi:MFS family permease